MQVRVTPQQAKQHFNLYVNCLVENPTFDSQMKECLQTPHTQFGSNATLPKRYLSQVCPPSLSSLISVIPFISHFLFLISLTDRRHVRCGGKDGRMGHLSSEVRIGAINWCQQKHLQKKALSDPEIGGCKFGGD